MICNYDTIGFRFHSFVMAFEGENFIKFIIFIEKHNNEIYENGHRKISPALFEILEATTPKTPHLASLISCLRSIDVDAVIVGEAKPEADQDELGDASLE